MTNFTPQQIEGFLREFFDVVGTRQYIGARYVPIFGRRGESSIVWDNTSPYEPLTIVLYQGNSFTSRQYVPAGVDIANTDYWANTGNYNSQIEQYRQEVVQLVNEWTEWKSDTESDLQQWKDDTEVEIADRIASVSKNSTNGIAYVIGHKGSSLSAPGNTLMSFAHAVSDGFDGIETDVQVTSDGVLVCFHDQLLNTSTDGSGYVYQHTWAEISALTITSGNHISDYPSDNNKIPKFSDFLSICKYNKVLPVVDIKNWDTDTIDITTPLADMLTLFNFESVYAMCNDITTLNNIKRKLPTIKTLYAPNRTLTYELIATCAENDFTGILMDAEEFVDLYDYADSLGVQIVAWNLGTNIGVNRLYQYANKAAMCIVDNIIRMNNGMIVTSQNVYYSHGLRKFTGVNADFCTYNLKHAGEVVWRQHYGSGSTWRDFFKACAYNRAISDKLWNCNTGDTARVIWNNDYLCSVYIYYYDSTNTVLEASHALSSANPSYTIAETNVIGCVFSFSRADNAEITTFDLRTMESNIIGIVRG